MRERAIELNAKRQEPAKFPGEAKQLVDPPRPPAVVAKEVAPQPRPQPQTQQSRRHLADGKALQSLRGENESLRGENKRLNVRLAEQNLAMATGQSIAREAEAALRKRELEIDQLRASNAKLQEQLKREQEFKQKVSTTTDRAQATTTHPHTAAYHVQSGTTAAKFQSVIDGVRDRSNIPKEWFVSAEPKHMYPLVLLFVKPSGPRLADGVVKYEEVEVCRKMVAPGGSLFICTMRGGNDPQAAKDLPAGCPPVEGLLDFCYISGNAQQPHTLNPASKMNDRFTRELHEAFKKVPRPPPPQPRLQAVGTRARIATSARIKQALDECYLGISQSLCGNYESYCY